LSNVFERAFIWWSPGAPFAAGGIYTVRALVALILAPGIGLPIVPRAPQGLNGVTFLKWRWTMAENEQSNFFDGVIGGLYAIARALERLAVAVERLPLDGPASPGTPGGTLPSRQPRA
jgi:hypothetical protein